jgi:fructokinase
MKKSEEVNESLCYVTVGTGVGIGLIINGKCVHGMVHPEGGHVSVKRVERDREFKGTCPFH